MIEPPTTPAVRVVAVGTTNSESRLMIIPVALVAGYRRILVGRRAMALLARHGGVQPNERKAGYFVIEGNAAPPIDIIVAFFAPLSQFSFVRVVLLVTGAA